MKYTKTRQQGNAITLTVPKSFNIKAGITVVPKLTKHGIFYEFIQDQDIWDFDTDVLQDLINQGYEGKSLINKFKNVKQSIPDAIDNLINKTKQEPILTKEEAEKLIGL